MTLEKEHIVIASDSQELMRKTAEFIGDLAARCINQTGRMNIALSGGSTPKILYKEFVDHYKTKIDWPKIFFFWSDERYVSLDDPQSNGGMAKEHLLEPLGIAGRAVHYVPTEIGSPQETALQYEKTIRRHFNSPGHDLPRFDLIMLGIGDDGHTASLFPGTDALHVHDKLVVENWVPHARMWRVTFTFPLINAAGNVLFLVVGKKKAEIIRELIDRRNSDLPARNVAPADGQLYWYLDKAAATHLEKG